MPLHLRFVEQILLEGESQTARAGGAVALRPPRASRRQGRGAQARRQAVEAAIERLDQLRAERDLSDEFVHPLRARHRDRLKHVEHSSDRDEQHRKLTEIHDEIELQLIAAERQHINELFRSGKLKDEARRRIERGLDLREVHLANQRAEE